MSAPKLRLGTRGSNLARTQTALACQALAAAEPELAAPGALEVVIIRTTGDRVRDRPLAELGGKGLFCKEIEAALLEGAIDLAVHSLKDLPTWLPDGLVLGAVLAREDPRDVLIARGARTLAELPDGALVGTASPRRQAQILARRPNLRIDLIRGNVETRIAKVEAGAVDATLLALAGLRRLAIDPAIGSTLSPDEMLPAVGQGAIGLECRRDDARMRALLARIDHHPTHVCIAAERGFLEALDGSCRTPIAGLAELADRNVRLRGLVAKPDGSACLTVERTGLSADAVELGHDAGRTLKARAGPDFVAWG